MSTHKASLEDKINAQLVKISAIKEITTEADKAMWIQVLTKQYTGKLLDDAELDFKIKFFKTEKQPGKIYSRWRKFSKEFYAALDAKEYYKAIEVFVEAINYAEIPDKKVSDSLLNQLKKMNAVAKPTPLNFSDVKFLWIGGIQKYEKMANAAK